MAEVGGKGGLCRRQQQERRQMRLQKCGGQRRGSVTARSSCVVGGNAVLLFIMPDQAEGQQHTILVAGAEAKRYVGKNSEEVK